MTNQELILGVMRAQGKADALDLRARAPELDGTALIDEENKIPVFDGSKDYTSWKAGSPVRELVDGEWQVFTLITPHNASHYPGSTPSNTPALWSIRHTKDPKRAKPWLAPNGTSGLYELDGERPRIPERPRQQRIQPLRAPGEVDGPRHHRGGPGSLM